MIFRFVILLQLLCGSCVSLANVDDKPPLQTVEYVDLQRYLGKWFEIASYPQSFQRGCFATTATYSAGRRGKIDVLNQCRKDSLNGKLKTAKGVAEVADTRTNAKLRVQFFWPFKGDYWIIELGDDYEYAVVGHPNREYLWILSRTPKMDDDTYQELLRRLEQEHFYDVSKLQVTPQLP